MSSEFPYWTSNHCARRLLLVMSWLCDDFTTCIVTSLLWRVQFNWNVPCDEFTVWRLHCKPTSHTGRTVTYCIHTRIIHQARGRQTVQNINEKHASSPSVATANASVVELLKLLILYNETAFPVDYKMWKWATIIHATNTRCVLCIKASMAGAWFIHWLVQLVCGLCGPCTGIGNWTARVYSSLWTHGLDNSWTGQLMDVSPS